MFLTKLIRNRSGDTNHEEIYPKDTHPAAAAPKSDDECSITSTTSSSCSSSTSTSSFLDSNSSCGNNDNSVVRFNMMDNKEYSNRLYCKEDCRAQWYRGSEIRTFKAEAAATTRDARHRMPYAYERVMTHVYNVCASIATEEEEDGNRIDNDNDNTCCSNILTTEEFHNLRRWTNCPCAQVGLERVVIRDIGRQLAIQRSEIKDTVIDMQDNLKDEQEEALGNNTNSGIITNVDIAERIRFECQHISRPSRLFARVMAHVHAAAMEKELQHDGVFVTTTSHAMGKAQDDDEEEEEGVEHLTTPPNTPASSPMAPTNPSVLASPTTSNSFSLFHLLVLSQEW